MPDLGMPPDLRSAGSGGVGGGGGDWQETGGVDLQGGNGRGGEGGRVRVGHHLVLHHGRKARRRARVDGSAVGRISFDATGAEASGGRGERVWRAEAVA